MAEKKDKKRDYYPFFNKKGRARYYLDGDKRHVYSWDGEPVAFVEKTAVFTFDQTHLGWYDDGWLRDVSGKCVGMVEPGGKTGPNPPKAKHPDPPADKKEPPEVPEIKDLPQRPPRKPVWSDQSDVKFFKGK